MAGLARILGLLLAGCYWLFVTGWEKNRACWLALTLEDRDGRSR
jgi:hypothetical protein